MQLVIVGTVKVPCMVTLAEMTYLLFTASNTVMVMPAT